MEATPRQLGIAGQAPGCQHSEMHETRVLSDSIVDLDDIRGLHGIGCRESGNTSPCCACGHRLSRLAVVQGCKSERPGQCLASACTYNSTVYIHPELQIETRAACHVEWSPVFWNPGAPAFSLTVLPCQTVRGQWPGSPVGCA
jgi:hypothetical protein